MTLFARQGTTPRCKNTFLVDDNSAFAQGYRGAFAETYGKLGGCLAGQVSISSAVQPSYASTIAQVMGAAPDCLLLLLFPDVGAAFIREAKATLAADRAHDWSKLTWIAGSPLRSQSFLDQDAIDPQNPGVQTAEGLYIGDGDTTPPTPDYYRFRAMYNAFYGRPPEQDTDPDLSNTYDAAVLLVLAVERAGTLDRVAVRDALWRVIRDSPNQGVYGPADLPEMLRILRLRSEVQCDPGSHNAPCEVRYHGASSPLVFDDYGTVSVPTAIYQLKGAGYTLVTRYDQAAFDSFEAAPATPPPSCPAP
jgi:ABC-type branched-subunit amino acid transport system substrate-binding protein